MRTAHTRLPWIDDVPVISGERHGLPCGSSAHAIPPHGSWWRTTKSIAFDTIGHSSASRSASGLAQNWCHTPVAT